MNLPGDIIRLTLLEVKLSNIVSCIISKRFLNILTEEYFISLYVEKNRQLKFDDLRKVLSATSADCIYKIVWDILQLNIKNRKYISVEYGYLYFGIYGKNCYDETALILASRRGHTEIVRLLLLADANIHDKDNEDTTALIWASIQGYTEIVRILLASGANVHDTDNYGKIALDYALKYYHTEIANLLNSVNKKN